MRFKVYLFIGAISLGYVAIALWLENPKLWERRSHHTRKRTTAAITLPKARVEGAIAHLDSFTPQIDPSEDAYRFLNQHRQEWRIQDYHDLKPQLYTTPLGTQVSYQVFQEGLPILGMKIVLQVDNHHEVTVIENGYEPVARVSLDFPEVTRSELESWVSSHGYRIANESDNGKRLMLHHRKGNDAVDPVYGLTVNSPTTGDGKQTFQILVRATDGQILGRTHPRAD